MAIFASLFEGGFFGGAFFGHRVEATDDSQRTPERSIYKPTGLPPYREGRKTVEQRVQETGEIHKEVREILSLPKPVKQMSLVEIEAEIGQRLRKKLKDEEIILMLLAAAAG